MGGCTNRHANPARIAIIGRARGGKSFLTSMFVEDSIKYRRVYSGNGGDKTRCPVTITVSNQEGTKEGVWLLTDFNAMYTNDELEGIKDIGEILGEESVLDFNSRISRLSKQGAEDSSEGMEKDVEPHDQGRVAEIEDVVWKILEIKKKTAPKGDKCEVSIQVSCKPSAFCNELLQEYETDEIQIIDTPGVSGSTKFASIEKSDIYIFLFKPDNLDEANTLKGIVKGIKSDVAATKTIFLYKREGVYLTPAKYARGQEAVRKDMETFERYLDELRTSVVTADTALLNPAKNCLLFPTMDSDEVTFTEKYFLETLKVELGKGLDAKYNTDSVYRRGFQEALESGGEDARIYTKHIMEEIPKHEAPSGNYSERTMIEEKHNRVKTSDRKRIVGYLEAAYQNESEVLSNYFSGGNFAQEKCGDWKTGVARYVHYMLTRSIRDDRGLGIGRHPMEERPPRTMLVQESVYAQRLLNEFNGSPDKNKYISVLFEGSPALITTKSGNFVYCNENDPEEMVKLRLAAECGDKVKTAASGWEFVLHRYVSGLRKIAQYDILKEMGYGDAEAFKTACELPF